MFHVLAGLARLAGQPMLKVTASPFIEAIAAETAGGTELWLANRTAAPQAVTLPRPARDAFVLDADSFLAATADPAAADTLATPFTGTAITLAPFAVARLRLS
jgi:hypothetical protein